MTEKFGPNAFELELHVGEGGVFEIELDGTKIYSKKETGAFPRYQEIPLTIEMKRAGM